MKFEHGDRPRGGGGAYCKAPLRWQHKVQGAFARIHETNLKKQGMLGLTFDVESDYDKIREDDTFDFSDLKDFAPGKTLNMKVIHKDGTKHNILLNHTYNSQQIEWFKEGSALNLIKKENA